MIATREDGTREDIYRKAVENFSRQFPELDAVTSLAQFLRKDSKTVYAYLSGRVVPSADIEEKIFRFCLYPRGFDEKKSLVFGMSSQGAGR